MATSQIEHNEKKIEFYLWNRPKGSKTTTKRRTKKVRINQITKRMKTNLHTAIERIKMFAYVSVHPTWPRSTPCQPTIYFRNHYPSRHTYPNYLHSLIHFTRQVPLHSSASTDLFIPNSIHPCHSYQTYQSLIINSSLSVTSIMNQLMIYVDTKAVLFNLFVKYRTDVYYVYIRFA